MDFVFNILFTIFEKKNSARFTVILNFFLNYEREILKEFFQLKFEKKSMKQKNECHESSRY